MSSLSLNDKVPVIDLAHFVARADDTNENHSNSGVDYNHNVQQEQELIRQVAEACSTVGFFQVVNHGIPADLVERFRTQCARYFTQLDPAVKQRQRRHDTNARGYFDDELTKQRRDWKQCLDVGVPGNANRDWNVLPDDHPANACLDGFNQFPDEESELPGFRSTVIEYFDACAQLSHRITTLMAAGILSSSSTEPSHHTNTQNGTNGSSASCNNNNNNMDIVQDLKRHHTSYLRMNYYPVCDNETKNNNSPEQEDGPLGISPHKDAGFLTVLLQDDDCHSLQVWNAATQNWHTVIPIPGALTINTGDMAQIWSNGKYQAPLHRVLTNTSKERYSAPFFYNPGYGTYVEPVISTATVTSTSTNGKEPRTMTTTTTERRRYHKCLWGYFRAVRFAGDLTDLGVEIQIEDYEISGNGDDDNEDSKKENRHLERQRIFAEQARFDVPFSVERFRDLLTG